MSDMQRVARATDIEPGKLTPVKVGDRSALLTRIDGRVVAIANWCPHLGLPLARGQLDGKVLRCPWHGSRFDICSGENLDWANAFVGIPMPRWTHGLLAMGKAPAPLETLAVEERDGEIYVAPPTKGKKRS